MQRFERICNCYCMFPVISCNIAHAHVCMASRAIPVFNINIAHCNVINNAGIECEWISCCGRWRSAISYFWRNCSCWRIPPRIIIHVISYIIAQTTWVVKPPSRCIIWRVIGSCNIAPPVVFCIYSRYNSIINTIFCIAWNGVIMNFYAGKRTCNYDTILIWYYRRVQNLHTRSAVKWNTVLVGLIDATPYDVIIGFFGVNSCFRISDTGTSRNIIIFTCQIYINSILVIGTCIIINVIVIGSLEIYAMYPIWITCIICDVIAIW